MKIFSLLVTLTVTLSANAEAKSIRYKIGAKSFSGYLSSDSKVKGKRPGIIIAPEWWGISDHEKAVADRLAALGYTVLVLDPYGNARGSFDPAKANEMMHDAQKDPAVLNQNFDKGLELLKTQPLVDGQRIAAIGYGFGGGLVLDQARLGKDLKLAVNYYGGLTNENARVPIRPIKSEILVLVGENDQYVPKGHIENFKTEMKGLRAKAEVVVFKGAYNSFANKLGGKAGVTHKLPFQYSETADAQAWDELTKNLKRVFAH